MTDPTNPATPEPTPAAATPVSPEPVAPEPATAAPVPPAANPYAAAPGATPYTAAPTTGAKAPILSILSLVAGGLGILGFAVVFLPFIGSFLQLFFPAAAIVLGLLGKSKEPNAPKGFWIAGIITGIVGLLIAIGAAILWGLLFAAGSSSSYY